MLLALPRLQAKERELQARAEMVTEVKARVEQLSMGALEVRGVCACVCLSLKCEHEHVCTLMQDVLACRRVWGLEWMFVWWHQRELRV